MSVALVGREVGKKQEVEISAKRYPEEQKDEWLLKMSRVRQRDKELRFTPEEYQAKTGRAAEVGRTFLLDPSLPGKVESVSEKEVVVRFSPGPGNEVTTPFGKGIIRERPERYEIVINAIPGRLVRTGAIVGRIVNVDDLEITVDYGHPFGGEVLRCELMIESVKSSNQEKKAGSVLGGVEGKRVEESDLVTVNHSATLDGDRRIHSDRLNSARDRARDMRAR